MQQADIIIIGAGAAGLMAAMQLARKGKKVLVLEARERSGGRIHTYTQPPFSFITELGAEFVHGQLPVTLALLNEANITPINAVGDMWRYNNGKFSKADQFLMHYDMLMKKLNALKHDITLDEFIAKHLSAKKYIQTVDTLRRFAAGYDTANPARFSVFAMREELQSEDDDHQYRVTGGYQAMIAYLEQEIKKCGGIIHRSTIAKRVNWQPGNALVTTVDSREFSAGKVIIALPLGVLQADKSDDGAITFTPPIPEREHALQQMGFGAIIKILLQFTEAFWEQQALKKGASADIKNMGYLFSNEAIPTWWTQNPHHTPLLTGWFGGPDAAKLQHTADDDILVMALQSLANIYDVPVTELRAKLQAHKVMNWLAEPFTRGSYSYATVATKHARELLLQPEQQTLYFVGEFMYDGPEMGTVEAALASGKETAEMIF